MAVDGTVVIIRAPPKSDIACFAHASLRLAIEVEVTPHVAPIPADLKHASKPCQRVQPARVSGRGELLTLFRAFEVGGSRQPSFASIGMKVFALTW